MIAVQYPALKPKVRNLQVAPEIFCIVRKKWLKLTPEEWVRQNMLLYLIDTLQYPKASIAVEKKMVISGRSLRFDILVYDAETQPWLTVECKEMKVELSNEVMMQALRYHSRIQGNYVIITNGSYTYGLHLHNGSAESINQFPLYPAD